MIKLSIVEWQKEIQEEVGVTKEEIVKIYNWNEWEHRIDSFLTQDVIKSV